MQNTLQQEWKKQRTTKNNDFNKQWQCTMNNNNHDQCFVHNEQWTTTSAHNDNEQCKQQQHYHNNKNTRCNNKQLLQLMIH